MSKRKPCTVEGCPYLKKSGHPKWCVWHYLAKQPAAVQVEAAEYRLSQMPEDQRRSRVSEREWPDGERWCAGCQWFVPRFYCSGSRCKGCASKARHAAHIERTFGITSEQYDAILAIQEGKCAICRGTPRSIRLAVDHDHKTGAVRGLLCSRCNNELLGAAHDDLAILRRAVFYLENPPASYI